MVPVMDIHRRILTPDAPETELLAILAREELAFRCLRARLCPAAPGLDTSLCGRLSGFPETGGPQAQA